MELRIGEVAGRAGVSVSAIRFYEREGLLPVPERLAGQRRFGPETIDRLHMIDVAKRAGLTLAEIRALLEATDRGVPAHEELRAIATRKLPEIDEAIERAEATRAWLAAASRCSCAKLESCALFG